MTAALTVSLIIPALDEAEGLGATLDGLAGQDFCEILVADGGSTDGTADIAAARPGVRVVTGARGRGAQMNRAASAAKGEALLFLHADTRLPADAAGHVRQALLAPEAAGGCFRLAFDRPAPTLRISEWFSRFDSGMTSFGDHAFFARRSAFEAVGGYPDWPLLEDVELRRRLKRLGRFVKAKAAVTTSARRFHAEGVLKRQARNGAILALHALGVSPGTLKRLHS